MRYSHKNSRLDH